MSAFISFAVEANTVNPGQTAIRSSLIWQYWLPKYVADKSADKSWMAEKGFMHYQNAPFVVDPVTFAVFHNYRVVLLK